MSAEFHSRSFSSVREKVGFYIEDIETPVGRSISLTITWLILISSAIFVVQTYPISDELRSALEILDSAILIGFAIEYVVRFWSAKNRAKFFFSIFSFVDLIAILPVFLGFLNLSYIRIFRWFRILRLVRFINFKISIVKIRNEDSIILARIIITLLTIIFVFSGLIYQVEHPVNPKIFRTFLDALYFSIVTMTTVGFGDVTPLSEMGRFLTILMILTGIALIPWQVGDLIKHLVKTSNQVETTCPGCGWASHDRDARFCKHCGTALD
ncbi:ion transporter [Lyngbya sp. CCY1209]|uniref:ion transporter n=1 Tax=Lyngbya sp. CCY1209 TaxID=2886103 RepID=UPI002D215C69|nr:ion transporter [Lyngbya sp. CCY1209]MEB3882702.1 ion transporter [Lyngbya sp. CCY1209]